MDGSRDLTSRKAVAAVAMAFLDELGWYPREPPAPDYGIDLFVEAADDGIPNGRLLAVQIKGGASFLDEKSNGHVVFRFEPRHHFYWLGYSLAVLVVMHDPDSGRLIWQVIDEQTALSTGKGVKVLIPETQVLDSSSAEALQDLAADTPSAFARLESLRADLGWMRLLEQGGRVLLEAAEWVNKSSGRGTVSLTGLPAGRGDELQRTRTIFVGSIPYDEVLPALVPWADVTVDEQVYDDAEEDQWRLETSIYDKEEGRLMQVGEDFFSWRASRGLVGIRPYADEAGEVAQWRLALTLNHLGRGLLAVEDHISGDS